MEKTKPESIIWYLIVFLILLFAGYLGYFIFLTITGNIEKFDNQQNYNRMRGITNICSIYDADYNSPECVDISFSDYDNSVKSIKAILDPGYGVDPDTGFVKYIGSPTKKNIAYGVKQICYKDDANYETECVDVNYIVNGDRYHDKVILEDGFIRDPSSGYPLYVGIPTNQTQKPLPTNFMFETHYGDSPTNRPRPTIKIPNFDDLDIDSKFDKDNIDIRYHADPASLPNAKDDLIGYSIQLDDDGNIDEVPYSKMKGKTLYNKPGTSRFGPSSYVPNYEESVFLSKLTNEMPFNRIPLSESGSPGFCKNLSLEDIEKKCAKLDKQTCASTECCVLFGGAKCVAGTETGPSKQSNYSDFLVKNRDYYFFKGSCYGNCSHNYGIINTNGFSKNNNYSKV